MLSAAINLYMLLDINFGVTGFVLQDTGVSVRKRVIKILKDICVMQPDFPKISEICVKIIRRIGDEEGIKVRGEGWVLYIYLKVMASQLAHS